MDQYKVTIYIETSLHTPRTGRGAYGYIVEYLKDGIPYTRQGFGAEEKTNENRLVLLALNEALSILTKSCYVRVNTLCSYVLNTCNNHLLPAWKKAGWMTAKKEPVKNRELWEEYQIQSNRHTMEIGRPTEQPYQSWLQGELRRELNGEKHLAENIPKRVLSVPDGGI